jgi:hypothetical protein
VSTSVRWRASDPDIVCLAWPGEQEAVAFSPRAGTVHVVTLSARNLLQKLVIGALTTSEIGAFVASDTGIDRSLVDDALPDLIETLREAELIQPAHS